MSDRIWITPSHKEVFTLGSGDAEFEKTSARAAVLQHASLTPIDHPDGSVSGEKIADGAVSDAKLALNGLSASTFYGEKTITGRLTALLEELLAMIVNLQGALTTDKTLEGLADEIVSHEEDGSIHVTASDKLAWDSKADGNHDHGEYYERHNMKNAHGGFAGLDEDGKISQSQLPEKITVEDCAAALPVWYGEEEDGGCELLLAPDGERYSVDPDAAVGFDVTISAVSGDLSARKTWRLVGSCVNGTAETVIESVIVQKGASDGFCASVAYENGAIKLVCENLLPGTVCFARGEISEVK